MIFVCTGTQIYQFNRLLLKIDELIESRVIKDFVFAQTGASTYVPKFYQFKNFLSHEEFENFEKEATIIISHGGTGALISSLKKGKNVIAVPRLAKYGEHVDDHQLQIVKVLEDEKYLRAVYDIDQLGALVIEAQKKPFHKVYERPSMVISLIENFIDSINQGSEKHE